jgi:hypothetical protein
MVEMHLSHQFFGPLQQRKQLLDRREEIEWLSVARLHGEP